MASGRRADEEDSRLRSLADVPPVPTTAISAAPTRLRLQGCMEKTSATSEASRSKAAICGMGIIRRGLRVADRLAQRKANGRRSTARLAQPGLSNPHR